MVAEKTNVGSLATTPTTDVLTPASSVREVGGSLPERDRNRRDSRRPPVGKGSDEDTLFSEIVDGPEHQLDRLG